MVGEWKRHRKVESYCGYHGEEKNQTPSISINSPVEKLVHHFVLDKIIPLLRLIPPPHELLQTLIDKVLAVPIHISVLARVGRDDVHGHHLLARIDQNSPGIDVVDIGGLRHPFNLAMVSADYPFERLAVALGVDRFVKVWEIW